MIDGEERKKVARSTARRRTEILKTKPEILYKKMAKKVPIKGETENAEVVVVNINGKKTRIGLDEQHE